MKQSRKNRIAFPVQLFESTNSQVALAEDNVREIHVVPTGKWQHWSGQEFEITADDVAEMVNRFNEGVRKGLRITAGHDIGFSSGELPAVGWFKELFDRGANGLYASVEWTKEGMRLLEEHAYKYFSAELEFNYRDLETEKEYPILLVGGALTNRPFFKQLDKDPSFGFSDEDKKVAETVLQFSVPEIINQFNDNQSMNKADILAKPSSEWTEEEIAFLNSDEAGLTDEEKAEHAEALGNGEGEGSGDGDGAGEAGDGDGEGSGEGDDGAGDGEGGDAGDGEGDGGAPAGVQASDDGKSVTLSAAAYEALTKKADEGSTALSEINKMKLEKRVDGLVLSAQNSNGFFKPNQKNALSTFLSDLSDQKRDQFTELVKNMPKGMSFSEIGEGDGGPSEASQKLITLAQKRAEEKGIKFSEALKQVSAENPDLEKEYNSGADA